MKTKILSPLGEMKTRLKLALLALALACVVGTAKADTYVMTTTIWGLNLLQQYLVSGVQPAVLPGPSDTIQFTGAAITAPLGANLSVNGINVDSTVSTATARIGATTGAALTIGAGGITKLVTGQKFELSCNITLGANQVWTNAGNNLQLDNLTLNLNGNTLLLNGGGTLDWRVATPFLADTNMIIQCAALSLNAATADLNLGSGSNSFKQLTITSGTVEGNSFPVDKGATTTSAFGNASSGTITLGASGSSGTLIYNGNTAASAKTITMDTRNSGADTIKVSTAGQTLTLTNLLYTQTPTASVSWNFGGAGNLIIASNIANANATFKTGVIKNDAGTLTLQGTNTYAANTIVNGGTFALAGSVAGSGTISNSPVIGLAGGTTFDVSGLASTFVLQSSQSISNTSATTATATLNGNINAAQGTIVGTFQTGVAPFSIANGTLTISSSTVFNLSGSATSPRFNLGTYTIIAKGTGGTVSGTPPNTTVGSLTLPGGTGHLVNNSGQLDLVVDTSTTAVTQPLHWVGSGGTGTWDVNNSGNTIWKDSTSPTPISTWFVTGDTVRFDEQYISADQTVTLNSTVTPASILVSNATYNYTISGSGTIATGLTKTGNANLSLQCVVNTTGGLTNNGGLTQLASSGAVTLSNLVENGGTVQLASGFPAKINSLTGSGGTLDLTTNILTVNLVNQTNTYTGTVLANFPAGIGAISSHAFGILVTNSGKQVLNGPVTISVDTSLATSQITSSYRIGSLNNAELAFGGTVIITNMAIRNNNSGITRVTGGNFNLISDGGNTYSGIILSDSSQFIVDGGSVSVPVVSIGFGAATGTPSLTVNSGSFTVVPGNVLGLEIGNNVGPAVTSTLNLNGGVLTTTAIVDGQGGDASYTHSGTNIINFNGGKLVCSAANVLPTDNGANGTNPLNLLVGNGGAVIDDGGYSQNVILPFQNYGTGGLTKLGSGTLTLNASNTYAGATLVQNGTLALSGTATLASSLIGVAGGATFDVTGLSSTFALGAGQSLSNSAASTGIVNGNVDATAGKVSVSFASGTPALTVANGALTLSAGTTVAVNNTGASLAAGTYPLITAGSGGSVAGTVPAVTVSGGGASGTASLQINSGELDLVITSSAPNPTNITYTVSGSTMTLNWPSGQGWLLQSNSVSLSNTGAWQTVTGATPPYPITVNPSQPAVFYRLKY